MTRLFLLLTLLSCVGLLAQGAAASDDTSVRSATRRTSVGAVDTVDVDLNSPMVELTIQVPAHFPGGHEPFQHLVSKAQPTAAICGTYFDKNTLRPIGDVVIDGEVRYKGLMGTVLAITEENEVVMRRVPWGRGQDWSGFRTVLGAGPTLVREGRVDVDAAGERFRDPHVLGSAVRAGAGITSSNHLLLAISRGPLTLKQWATAMKELGCRDAMCLDGGGSLALYYRGKYLANPGRRLTNVLVVRDGRSRVAPLLASSTEALFEEADSLLAAGDPGAAASTLIRAGDLLGEEERWEDAVAAYQRATALSRDPLSYEGLARACRQSGRISEAEEAHREAGFLSLAMVDPAAEGAGDSGTLKGRGVEESGWSVEGGILSHASAGLTLTVPPGWEPVSLDPPTFSGPGREALVGIRLVSSQPETTLADFETSWSDGTARVLQARTGRQVEGQDALVADYEQVLDGRVFASRVMYTQRGGTVGVISMTVPGESRTMLEILDRDWFSGFRWTGGSEAARGEI